MAEPPPIPNHDVRRDLLAGMLSVGVLVALIGWQWAGAKNPAPPAEITSADRALILHNDKPARRELERLIAQAPDAPIVYEMVIGECLQRNRPDLGMIYAYRAIDACKYAPNANRAGLYSLLSALYTLQKEGAGQRMAREYARRAFELAPDDAQALNGYGYTLLETAHSQPEVNLALSYIQKALQTLRAQSGVSPGALAPVEDSYGWGLYKRGQYNPADYAASVNALRQALDDVPEETSGQEKKTYYYHLGAACHALGHVEEARHALQIALFYDPKYPEALKEMQALPSTAASALPSASSVLPTPAPAASSSAATGRPAFQPLDHSKSTP